MKTAINKTVVVLALVTTLWGAAAWGEESEINVMGPYLEFGPTLFLPIGNRQTGTLFNEEDGNHKIGFGGGGYFAAGFDTQWIGIGTKLRMEAFEAERPSGKDTGMIYQWDIAEVRLFVLDWFREHPGKLRPYLLAGAGYNLNSASAFGAQANFGAGVQYQLSEHLYVGLETTYRHLIFDEDVPSLATAATVGFRF